MRLGNCGGLGLGNYGGGGEGEMGCAWVVGGGVFCAECIKKSTMLGDVGEKTYLCVEFQFEA